VWLTGVLMGCPGCPLAPPKGLGPRAPKRKKSISPANGIGSRFGDGQSLVGCALEQGHKDIAKYLEDAGVERD
jgi:hypothetical protein